MRDPHVVRLWYEVQHAQNVDFESASPLVWEEPDFRLRLEDGTAQFEMLSHFSSEDEARAVVDPFICAWELNSDLENPSERFRLAFKRPEIVDRSPEDGRVHVVGLSMKGSVSDSVQIHVHRGNYPVPAPHLGVNETVGRMWQRYRRCVDGATELPSAVNYCLTEAEALADSRKEAARLLQISFPVMQKMAKLAATKGGSEARKAYGANEEYSAQEREWLMASLKALVKRVAEYAGGALPSDSQLTMRDLPPLDEQQPS